MRILFLIARQFNQILQVKELMAKGMDKGAIASRIKVPPFVGRQDDAPGQDIYTGADPFLCDSVRGSGRSGEDRAAE